MTTARERQRAHQQDLLTALDGELKTREITTVLIVDGDGNPCLEVVDRHFRTRRVYVQTAFHWFYWSDEHDERVSSLHLQPAAERIAEAARAGWREGEQGTLRIDLRKIADAYRC
ncbi:hypothetical protein GCM10010517_72900 [Streptosporangium fragile]|uniref:Pyridoxamine 5'-phosphate oxidase putative domain-containing protein n=1 Tax=Streptosporangium fragile TaxID=46186 RepID=A0ABN3W8I0_9ACTN